MFTGSTEENYSIDEKVKKHSWIDSWGDVAIVIVAVFLTAFSIIYFIYKAQYPNTIVENKQIEKLLSDSSTYTVLTKHCIEFKSDSVAMIYKSHDPFIKYIVVDKNQNGYSISRKSTLNAKLDSIFSGNNKKLLK